MRPKAVTHLAKNTGGMFTRAGQHCRPESAEDKGVAKESMQTEHRQPMGLLRAAAIGVSIGVASAMLYLWSMERRRQDDLAWAYYRTH